MIQSSKIGENAVVALDPGAKITGMVLLEGGRIAKAANVENGVLFNIMFGWGEKTNIRPLVLIEDVRPYGVRLSQDFIDTCKWIGELEYRLKSLNIAYKLIPRSTVRKWVFDSYPEISIPKIEQIIICRDHRRKDGEYCKPSARYVNDGIIEAAMRHAWQIERPKPGKKNKYGLSEHSYQALALTCCVLDIKDPKSYLGDALTKYFLEAQQAVSDRKAKLKRQDGAKGGKIRARNLSPERRSEIARKAILTRWSKNKI